MLPWFATLQVERQRGTTTDDFHGGVTDWSDPDTVLIDDCWIGRQSGIELSEGRQTVITDVKWWGPEYADVQEGDRIKDVERGVVYDVAGPVLWDRDPVREGHKSCVLREVRG